MCAVYHYTNRLGPLFLGLVPYLIPVAWFMMSYASFVIADWLIPADWKRGLRILSVAAVGGPGHGPDHGGAGTGAGG